MDESMYQVHSEFEENHWWFLARQEIVLALLDQHISKNEPLRLLDIGCGTGKMLQGLRSFGDVMGLDMSSEAIELAKKKTRADVRYGKLPDEIPFSSSEFDVITMLDVLEHVNNDMGSLDKVFELLKPAGILLCTVPAFMFLWSDHDTILHHQRRYTIAELDRKLHASGFRIKKISYFNTFLFLPILVVRMWRRLWRTQPKSDFHRLPSLMNLLLKIIFSSEWHLLKSVSFPFGVSIITLAEKPYDVKNLRS